MSKIFVTGSKGFVAKNLIPKLEKLGHSVFTDQLYMNALGWKFDCIIHLAAVTHIHNIFDPKLIEANFILTNEIFKREERIIYASSCSAAHFTNPYAMSKQWAEYLGKKHGNALGLRFFNVYGPNNNKGIVKFLTEQPDGAKITIRGPELVRDYIHVDDVVKYIIDNLGDKIKKVCSGYKCISVPIRNIGLREVGTGVGCETMELVNVYQRLSGKTFNISVDEAGSNEPPSMVAKTPVENFITLEQGLTKLINNG